MEEHKIENIELKYLTVDDFEELKSATLESYGVPTMFLKS